MFWLRSDDGTPDRMLPDSGDALSLFEAVLTSPWDRALLDRLQNEAGTIVPLLDDEVADIILERHAEHVDPEWLRHVCETLLTTTHQSLGGDDMVASLDRDNVSDLDTDVGSAFRELLLRSLPEELTDFKSFFSGLPTVEDDVFASLLALPEVDAAGHSGADLAQFAIIPSTIGEAALALSTAAAEVGVRADGAVLPVLLMLDRESVRPRSEMGCVARHEAIEHIGFVTDLWPETCARLLDWIGAALRYRPMLIKGFRAYPKNHSVLLQWHDSILNLNDQWSIKPDEIARIK